MFTEEEMKEFLYSAKQATYASGNNPRKYANGLKVYNFKKDRWIYKDIYYGNIIDAGFEVVFYENQPLWSMSYRGGMKNNLIDSKECFSFLVKAISNTNLSFPVRGPSIYEYGGFTYNNFYVGHIFDFLGYEVIYSDKTKIYFKKYFGGSISFRENQLLNPLNNSISFLFASNSR